MLNAITKVIILIVGWVLALVPLWFFLFLKSMLAPVGFLQNFLVYGVGIYCLAGAQFVFIVFAIFATISVLLSK